MSQMIFYTLCFLGVLLAGAVMVLSHQFSASAIIVSIVATVIIILVIGWWHKRHGGIK
jgi:hypothetical protein